MLYSLKHFSIADSLWRKNMNSIFYTSSFDALKRYLCENKFAFTDDQEAVWREFVDASTQFNFDRDFFRESILGGDYQMCFKRRILLTCLVPVRELLSFYCPATGHFYFTGPHFTIRSYEIEKKIPSDLYQLAAELVCAFKHFLENNRGGIGEIEAKNVDNLLHDYNKTLIKLLTLVPEDSQEQVYNHISLCSADTYYGYEPFSEMMKTGGNEKWKRWADSKMRQYVTEELEGCQQPKSGSNNDSAVSWYLRLVLDIVNYEWGMGRALPYSLDLLRDQLLFMRTIVNTREEKIGGIDIQERVFDHAIGVYAPLRRVLAKILVFSHRKSDMSFIGYSSGQLKFAKKLLAEFGSQDSELYNELVRVIPIAEVRIADSQEKHKEREMIRMAKKQSILLRMENSPM